jgi:hypothetical protein
MSDSTFASVNSKTEVGASQNVLYKSANPSGKKDRQPSQLLKQSSHSIEPPVPLATLQYSFFSHSAKTIKKPSPPSICDYAVPHHAFHCPGSDRRVGSCYSRSSTRSDAQYIHGPLCQLRTKDIPAVSKGRQSDYRRVSSLPWIRPSQKTTRACCAGPHQQRCCQTAHGCAHGQHLGCATRLVRLRD